MTERAWMKGLLWAEKTVKDKQADGHRIVEVLATIEDIIDFEAQEACANLEWLAGARDYLTHFKGEL